MSQTTTDVFLAAGERIRLLRDGFSQAEFAERLGVDRKSVNGWETGKRLPDGSSLLKLMVEFGADVNYILSGQRASTGASLSRDRQALLNSYELCGAEARKSLLQMAALLAAGENPARARGISQTSSGDKTMQIAEVKGGMKITQK